MLRFPDGMRDRISEAAKAAGRSMNAEIISRLDGTFRASQADLQRLVNAELTSITHRGEKATLQGRLLQAKLDQLKMETRVRQLEAEQLAATAKTDADFSAVRQKIDKDFELLDTAWKMLEIDRTKYVEEREEVIAEFKGVTSAMGEVQSDLESKIEAYRVAHPDSPAVLAEAASRAKPIKPSTR